MMQRFLWWGLEPYDGSKGTITVPVDPWWYELKDMLTGSMQWLHKQLLANLLSPSCLQETQPNLTAAVSQQTTQHLIFNLQKIHGNGQPA